MDIDLPSKKRKTEGPIPLQAKRPAYEISAAQAVSELAFELEQTKQDLNNTRNDNAKLEATIKDWKLISQMHEQKASQSIKDVVACLDEMMKTLQVLYPGIAKS